MTYSFSLAAKKPHLFIISLFFLLMCALLYLSPNVSFQAPIPSAFAFLLTLLSTSAGNPYFIISSAVLALLALTLKLPYQRLCIVYLQFALILALSFVLKSVVKDLTKVPRPFVEQLVEQKLVVSSEQFYLFNESEKDAVINKANQLFDKQRLKHWYGDSNYSFPSGHSIFVATCVVFWGGLFLTRGAYWLCSLTVAWAIGVAFSRYWLGMHWPTDILMSICCAALLMLCVPTIKLSKG